MFLALVALLFAPVLPAQLYRDLIFTRNRPSPYSTVLEARAGLLGGFPETTDAAVGLESNYGADGYVYYREEGFGSANGLLQVYAGRDGAYLSVLNKNLVGSGTESRLELTTRYFPFYREGFYRRGNFVPTGRYEGDDWGVSLSFAKPSADGMLIDGGVFYRSYGFERNRDTDPGYVIPEDYDAYGFNFWMEHNTLVLDRQTGLARDGFILTLGLENEHNDSSGSFGVVGVNESELPSTLWRGRGHLEWYFPQSETAALDVILDGILTDDKDRVTNYDAQKPQGHFWIDGQVGYRFGIGSSFFLRPYGEAQYLQILDESGTSDDDELFWGGGIDMTFSLGGDLALVGYYSYLSNESRAPISVQEDTWGEHRFFIGIEARLMGQRK